MPEQKIIITKKEWRFVLLFSIIIAAISALPYLIGYFNAPPDKQFTGVHIVNTYDTYWYISLIEQAREGNILFKYLSFPEYQQPIIFHPLFLLMGLFAWLTGFANIFVYHLFRIILGIIFLWLSYVFISYFLENTIKRKIALFFLATGSGLGWLAAFFVNFNTFISGDFWIKEINGFLTLYESPLDLAGNILIIIIFLSFLKLINSPPKLPTKNLIKKPSKYALFCGFGFLFLLLVHPYVLLTIIATIFIYLTYLIAARRILLSRFYYDFLAIILIALPGLLYNYYAITASPALSFWLKAAKTPYELSWSYFGFLFLGLGMLLFFSLAAIYKIFKEKNTNLYFLVIWFFTAFFFALQPWINFQLKFLEGIMLAASILSAKGAYLLINYLKKFSFLKISRQLTLNSFGLIIIIASFTNIFILLRDLSFFSEKQAPFYLKKNYSSAFSWIKNNAEQSDTILTNYDLGYFIPGTTGNPIFLGLLVYPETEYHQKKIAELKWFFEEPANEKEKYAFLKENNIKYFLYAPDSASDSNKDIFFNKQYYYNLANFSPQNITGLKIVYSNNKATIYKIE